MAFAPRIMGRRRTRPRPAAVVLAHSRAVTVRLDLATHVATLIKSDNQPEGLVAPVEGNAQTTRNGDLFGQHVADRVAVPRG